jgi:hypothetical protein
MSHRVDIDLFHSVASISHLGDMAPDDARQLADN